MTDKTLQKKKSSLMRAFAKVAAKVVLVLLATCSIAYGGGFAGFYAGRGEKLTPGETQMVQGVFGPEINASKLRKHFRDTSDITHCVAPKAVATVLPPFSHIDFFGPNTWSSDYSKEGEYKYSLFMHEATHTWQGQNLAFPMKNFEIYPYTLTPASHWRDFGAEQQADMIGNYSKRWLHPKNVTVKHTAEDALLARVVEDRFPQAHKTRIALEGKNPININQMIAAIPAATGSGGNHPAGAHAVKPPPPERSSFPFLTLCK